MKNQDVMEEIFNPKPMEIIIGDPDSQILACGKNQNCELTFKGYNYLMYPSGLKIQKKSKIINVATGREHTALLTEYGYVYVFGSTLHNKLGLDGTQVTNISAPKLLPLSQELQLSQVACGDYHTLTLTDQGEVWSFGGTLHKKTGDRNPKPTPVRGLNNINIVKIGCGDFHSVALSDQGILYTWGGGGSKYNKGQLGHGILDDVMNPMPIQHFQNSPVHDFDCGGYHTVSIQADGLVFAWGNGQFGQLGNGTFEDSYIPKQVDFDENIIIVQIACGGHHTYFLSDQGRLYSCGKGTQGQTGQLKAVNYPVPTLVQCFQEKFVEQISCGWNHAIALVNPNHVYSTGLNNYGQLGLGHQDNKMGFTWIDRLAGKNISVVKAGGDHSWFLLDIESPLVNDYRPPSPLYQPPDEPLEKKKTMGRSTSQNFQNKRYQSNFRERLSNTNVNIGPRQYTQDGPNDNKNRMPTNQGDDRANINDRRSNPLQGDNYSGPNNQFMGRGDGIPDGKKSGNFLQGKNKTLGDLQNYHGQNSKAIKRNEEHQPEENIFVDEDESNSEVFSEDVQDPDTNLEQNDPQKNVFQNSVEDQQFEQESQNYNDNPSRQSQPRIFQDEDNPQINEMEQPYKHHQAQNPNQPQSLKSLENSIKKPSQNKSKGSFLKSKPDTKIEKKPETAPRKKYDMKQTPNYVTKPFKKQHQSQQNITPIGGQPQKLFNPNQQYNNGPNPGQIYDNEDDDEFPPYRGGHQNNNQPKRPNDYESQPNNRPNQMPTQNFFNQGPSNIDEDRKNFIINQIWKQSAYNMLLVDLELNHKFILLDYKPNKQNELLQAIHNSIEQIQSQDPALMQYNVIKYNDFVNKSDKGLLQTVMSQAVQIEQGMSDNIFVVMLVQQQNLFISQYNYSVPDSNYNMLNFRESSLGPFYQFYPEEIERDKKWKLLSRAYEILLSNVYEYINLFTIYELRSSKYR